MKTKAEIIERLARARADYAWNRRGGRPEEAERLLAKIGVMEWTLETPKKHIKARGFFK